MDRKNTEYLSHRVFLLSAAAALLILFLLLFCLKMIIFEEGSLWPFFLGLTAFSRDSRSLFLLCGEAVSAV
mgnify:CR=1 FL=1